MNEITKLLKPSFNPDCWRLRRPKIKRDRSPIPVQIVRDLGDRSLFPRVHRFRSDPMRFAIHSHIPIREHMLLDWEGVVYKVAAIDRFEVGTLHGAEYYYEVKCLIWKRYQK